MFRLTGIARAVVQRPVLAARAPAAVRLYSQHLSEAEFDAKWTAYFSDNTLTQRDVRSGLNDVFAHDAVPHRSVLEAAFRAARRTNDFPTTVRIFEGIMDKCQNDSTTYNQVVSSLKPVIDELHLTTPEQLGLSK
eukprot:m.319774 g.319774  ORF g.319774 m.319774 type:complete len:135 (+) comp23444_c0_seq1:196-600(+)